MLQYFDRTAVFYLRTVLAWRRPVLFVLYYLGLYENQRLSHLCTRLPIGSVSLPHPHMRTHTVRLHRLPGQLINVLRIIDLTAMMLLSLLDFL
jgi:hypothetical protein